MKSKPNLRFAKKIQPKREILGVVCCYFNPCNFLSRFINFIEFYYSMSTQENIKLIVVESYASDSKYRINEIVENITSVSTDEIYWQKEQLLNIGIKQLIDEKLEYIAWVDTDISFLDDAWVERSIKNINRSAMTG